MRKDLTDRSQHVMSVILVKGIPFYGYHGAYSYFLKIYLYPFALCDFSC